ncbi:S24 family peptidase [Metapseudomonas boanensis]|uniref:Helix-turn-helix transcriptional regulator n=1 Tax=Metapseudomonas boanensis TaxID=2822138 RepID=A0ABS5XAZ4_9GAMM|nr:S24 family peptidase [Pseudomonas boanensis]MBT8764854.1 helix-turn-helix transcriptional regulator [Pseudomonas boanensis]
MTGSVPVVGKAVLGPEGYFEAMESPVEHSVGFLNIYSSDPDAYGLRVVGNSMNPRIKNNEFVLVEPSKNYVAGDEVLVKTTKGRAMIKEFIYYRDGQYRFDSVNADCDPIFIHEDEVAAVQYVGAIVKSARFTAVS